MTAARIVVAGTHSGVGKTTIATALMAAFRRRGHRVQGFKVGPDFIDPTFHRDASGRPSRNLDGWMLSRETNLAVFQHAAQDADVAVIEGVMGLFDGQSASELSGSTAEMAMWLDAAVVLVVDASAMAGSVAAVVHGFDHLVPELRLAAVVCNRVSSDRHYDYLRGGIAARCRPESVGYLPPTPELSLPERHLGLHLASEVLTEDRLCQFAEWAETHLDLDRLIELGRQRKALDPPSLPLGAPSAVRTRIGVARDTAFCFYYEDNLDLLRALGAEVVEFSPIKDAALPEGLGGIYFGGGYPELHAQALATNESMRAAVAQFVSTGGPVYAECGGFMYLTEAIVDAQGGSWPMAGVFPTRARMQTRLVRLGYMEVEGAVEDGWLVPGVPARGHEFRYSVIDPMPDAVNRVYRSPAEGYGIQSTLASYIHLHFLSCQHFADRFVTACTRYHSTI